jgi:hypothetical protein
VKISGSSSEVAGGRPGLCRDVRPYQLSAALLRVVMWISP